MRVVPSLFAIGGPPEYVAAIVNHNYGIIRQVNANTCPSSAQPLLRVKRQRFRDILFLSPLQLGAITRFRGSSGATSVCSPNQHCVRCLGSGVWLPNVVNP